MLCQYIEVTDDDVRCAIALNILRLTRRGSPHLQCTLDPQLFDRAVTAIRENKIAIAYGPVTRPTGRGVYFYDPDGFMMEIRCDPEAS